MDLMDKERALNNYIDIIKAHIEGKTILELINEKEAINQYVFQVKAMQ